MIDVVNGPIRSIQEKSITVMVGGLGLAIAVARPESYIIGKEITLFTYLHWNQEHGFNLIGFATELERTVFLLIISCSKIGPTIGLSILSQTTAHNFLHLINHQNAQGLSSLQGIGAKKAEQLIVELKHKVAKLIASGNIVAHDQELNTAEWQNLSDVLSSLNYSKQEIQQAMAHLTATHADKPLSLDHLIRSALAFLAAHR